MNLKLQKCQIFVASYFGYNDFKSVLKLALMKFCLIDNLLDVMQRGFEDILLGVLREMLPSYKHCRRHMH